MRYSYRTLQEDRFWLIKMNLIIILIKGATSKDGRFTVTEGYQVSPGGSDGKVSVYCAGDLGTIPGSGRFHGEGKGNPLQYACLENPMGGGAWRAISTSQPPENHLSAA